MNTGRPRQHLLVCGCVYAALALAGGSVSHLGASDRTDDDDGANVDFNRDVRPILAANCYACHGPDPKQRKAKLRLDQKEPAFAARRGGRHAIVPGDPGKSALVMRISSRDEDEVMPPPESGKKLTAGQIDTLRKWIEQGAKWDEHWAYVAPRRHPLPSVQDGKWAAKPVDRFILARLETEGLSPAPRADRVTLLRRLSFDLLGLPPTREELDVYLADKSPEERAYEKQVDRLLRSPHYGERMAMFWLDLVRFADTRGYHSDNPRNVTPYRDYVIRSFNDNLAFDQFTIEQLAGDLLPEPDVWQRVATCYNKLNQTTEEGGAQAQEYEAMNASDRVRNVSVVWMGATLGCAQCHEHKFDPYPAEDFYQLAAFFADIKEAAIMDRDKGIPVPSPEHEAALQDLAEKITAVKIGLENLPPALAAELEKAQAKWEGDVARRVVPELGPWYALGPFLADDARRAFETSYPPEEKIDLEASYQKGKLKWQERAEWKDGAVHNLTGTNAATYLYRSVDVDSDSSLGLSLGSDDGIRLWINGQEVLSKDVQRGVAPDQEKVTVSLRAGKNQLLMKITNAGGGYGFYFKALGTDGVPAAIRAVLKIPPAERSDDQSRSIAAYYRTIAPQLQERRARLARLEKERGELQKRFPRCVVSVSGPPRVVRVLSRGNWQDRSGPVVQPAIPSYFGKLDTGGERATRMDLARWIVSRHNPLTARVFVNRLWKLFFGTGISKRLDDLGAMGESPVHPELLDWLAMEFMESGWDIKHMVKSLVMSSTYRQSSVPSPAAEVRDPYNRLLARQSRWRLEAEVVRDNALAVSGLLSRKIGGPSVKPYQPAGYWVHLNFPKRKWVADSGPKAYRRGLYTWWQRSFLHPSLMAFDAPNREECTAERARSNIPQQALVLLNDPTYVEASRVFAQRIMLQEGEDTTETRVRWAFRQAVSRQPDSTEVEILAALYAKHRESYAAEPKAAGALLKVGKASLPEGAKLVELAAWTSVARAILNLHETVTRN